MDQLVPGLRARQCFGFVPSSHPGGDDAWRSTPGAHRVAEMVAATGAVGPGFIQGLYSPEKTTSIMGRLGSIESPAPALAAIAGAYLLEIGSWKLFLFHIGAASSAGRRDHSFTASVFSTFDAHRAKSERAPCDPENIEFVSYASSQAFSLGALLVFVFGAQAVLTAPLDREISDFVVLQIFGIAAFILAANSSAWLAMKFDTLRTIRTGTTIVPVAFLAILAYALAEGNSFSILVPMWVLVNFGFGIRGPIGFHRAIIAARGDPSRAAAIVVAAILGIATFGTIAVAPFILVGLLPLTITSSIFSTLALVSITPLRITEEYKGMTVIPSHRGLSAICRKVSHRD